MKVDGNVSLPDALQIDASMGNEGKKKKAMQKRLKVWQHVNSCVDSNGKSRVGCKYFNKDFVACTRDNGTTSIKTHVLKCKKNLVNMKYQFMLKFCTTGKEIKGQSIKVT